MDDRNIRAIAEARKLMEARYDAEEDDRQDGQGAQKGLWMAAERWRRLGAKDGDGGLTLVVMHGNGFAKEVRTAHWPGWFCLTSFCSPMQSWRPAIHRLVSLGPISSTSTFGVSSSAPALGGGGTWMIDDIWFLEHTHAGASVDLNAGLIGVLHEWMDGARDVLNFIEHVMPSPEHEGEEVLQWKATDSGSFKGKGQGNRKIIGVGHSVGGNTMYVFAGFAWRTKAYGFPSCRVQAAHARPDVFDALFLAEPIVNAALSKLLRSRLTGRTQCPPIETPRSALDDIEATCVLLIQTCKRRSHWPSIEAASAIRASSFFEQWHDESFSIFLSHLLVPHPDGGVQLATPTWCEAVLFGEPAALRRGWDKLGEVEVPVGFLMSGNSWTTYGDEYTRSMVWRPRNARNERIMSASHQVSMEKSFSFALVIR